MAQKREERELRVEGSEAKDEAFVAEKQNPASEHEADEGS